MTRAGRSVRWLLGAALLATTLVTSPLSACQGEPAAPQVVELSPAEVARAIDGEWQLTIPASGSSPAMALTLWLAAPPPPAAGGLVRRPGCASASLIKCAAACVTLISVPVQVTVLRGEVAAPTAVFEHAANSERGRLRLTLGPRTVEAALGPAGVAEDVVHRVVADGPWAHDATLTRSPAPM